MSQPPWASTILPTCLMLCLALLAPDFVSASPRLKPSPTATATAASATTPAATSGNPIATNADGSTPPPNLATSLAEPATATTKLASIGGEPQSTATNPAATAAEPAATTTTSVSASAPPADERQARVDVSAQPQSPSRVQLDEIVEATAKRHGVELALVKAVVAAESAYDTRAVSRAGALGLMQVMPATAADYGIGDREKLFDPETNLDTGTRHLKRLLTKYKDDYGRAIMAYNAGEGVVDRTGSLVTYAETLSYTEAVIRHYRRQGGAKPTDEAMAKVRQLRLLKGQQANQLLAKYLDLNLPSLRGNSRTIRVVAPGLDENGAQRRPMIVLEAKKPQD